MEWDGRHSFANGGQAELDPTNSIWNSEKKAKEENGGTAGPPTRNHRYPFDRGFQKP